MYCPYHALHEALRAAGLEVRWYDENGVPRHEPFHPSRVADVYAREAILALLQCQGCRREIPVALTSSRIGLHRLEDGTLEVGDKPLPRDPELLSYGDAPCWPAGSSCAGSTMSSDVVRLLEVWVQDDDSMDWVREA